MIIDFEHMEEARVANFKGGEKEYIVRTYLDEQNRIMHGTLVPGASIGYHKHEQNSETFYIISGSGKVILENGEERVKAGDLHYCPMGHSHSLVNDGNENLVFIGIVSEHHA